MQPARCVCVLANSAAAAATPTPTRVDNATTHTIRQPHAARRVVSARARALDSQLAHCLAFHFWPARAHVCRVMDSRFLCAYEEVRDIQRMAKFGY